MTWLALLSLAILLSFMSLRYINILLSLAASISWLALMAYNLDNPLSGITQGSTIHEWTIYIFIALAIAVMYMWFRNRNGAPSVFGQPRDNTGKLVNDEEPEPPSDGSYDYQKTVREALRRKRRA